MMTMDLIECIATIKTEQAKLPAYDYTSAESRDQHRQAVAAMVETLTAKLPKCRINNKWNGTSVSIAGIRATCTGGIEGGLTNWIAAARRRLDQTGFVQPTGEKENVR